MIADGTGLGGRFLPEIHIRFRSSRIVRLSSCLQVAVLSVLLAGTAALAYVSVSRHAYQHRLAGKTAEVGRAETLKAALRDQIGGLQKKLAVLTFDRDQAQNDASALARQTAALRSELAAAEARLKPPPQAQAVPAGQSAAVAQPPAAAPAGTPDKAAAARPPAAAAVGQPPAAAAKDGQPPVVAAAGAAAKDGQPADLAKTLDQTRQALQQEKAQSAALTERLGQIEAGHAAEEAQLAQYKASLEETARELGQLGAARGRGAVPPARFRLRLGAIWRKLSELRIGPAEPQVASGAPNGPAPPDTASEGGVDVASFGRSDVVALEHALASAGVDVKRALSQFGAAPAEGGPFVPPPKSSTAAADAVSPEKLAALQGLAKTLPVAAPLVHYDIGSPFGVRVDPFNRRPGFHTGIDMDAPYKSPVYATAPGTIIYAGWLGDYGKVVEIDHGFGIVTLYAHLQRWLVAVGQQVAANTEIGLLGTTGRSTGPHVHYEVRVDGQPQDPEKFLGLARLLPVAGRQVSPAVGGPAESSR